MISLSLQSSSHCVSVAIYKNKRLIYDIQNKENDTNRSEQVILLIERSLQKIGFQKIDEIIISRGPGSFTSIRAQISIAQGLALAFNAKIKTVDTFQVLISSDDFSKKNCVTIFKESRQEYYCQSFKKVECTWKKDCSLKAINENTIKKLLLEKFENQFDGDFFVVTDYAYPIFKDFLSKKFDIRIINISAQNVFSASKKKFASRSTTPLYFFKHYAK